MEGDYMGYKVINGHLYEMNSQNNFVTGKTAKLNNDKSNLSFQSILNKETKKEEQFTLSNHAAERLKDRNISLNEADMNKINEGINRASQKGSNDCLILYKDIAMIANIKNRTVITAVDKGSSKGNVFTNIDSVVLL